MEEKYKFTYDFLITYIKTKGKTTFSRLSVKEYNNIAREHTLFLTPTIKYITGLSWRNYKNKLLSEFK